MAKRSGGDPGGVVLKTPGKVASKVAPGVSQRQANTRLPTGQSTPKGGVTKQPGRTVSPKSAFK